VTDAVDVFVARFDHDDNRCFRAADHVVIDRWDGVDLVPPLRLWMSADELSAHVAKLAEAAVGAFRNDRRLDRDDGWKLLGVHLDETIATRAEEETELVLPLDRAMTVAEHHEQLRA
jgi:hypothetical protein